MKSISWLQLCCCFSLHNFTVRLILLVIFLLGFFWAVKNFWWSFFHNFAIKKSERLNNLWKNLNINRFECVCVSKVYLADCRSAEDLARHPAVSWALCGGRAGVALASGQYWVKVEVEAVSVHEVTVDDVVHVTIQVLGEHVHVQVCGQPVLTGLETGRSSELTHPLQAHARIGWGDGHPVMRAHSWHRGVMGFERRELWWVLRHTWEDHPQPHLRVMLVLLWRLLLLVLRLLLLLLVMEVMLLWLHLGLQRHGGHCVQLQSFTQQQLIGFGPHAHHGRAHAHQAHPSRIGHEGIHLGHHDITGRGGVGGEKRLQAGRHVGAEMAATAGGGAGHGVEEGVAEGWRLFAAWSTLRDGGLGPGVGGGLWEAGWLQLMKGGEAGATRQQRGGGGQWSRRCWWGCTGTGPSLLLSHQSEAVDQIQLLHEGLGEGGGQAAGSVSPQQWVLRQVIVILLSRSDGGQTPTQSAGVGARARAEGGPHVAVVQAAAGWGAAAVDPFGELLGWVGAVCARWGCAAVTLQRPSYTAQPGCSGLLLGLLGPHAALQQFAAVVHGGGSAARSFPGLPSLWVEHPPGALACRFIVNPQELVVEW